MSIGNNQFSNDQYLSKNVCQHCSKARILFFPDETALCHQVFNNLFRDRNQTKQNLIKDKRQACYRRNCSQVPCKRGSRESSLLYIFNIINDVTRQIDVCMYRITYYQFTALLIRLHGRNIQIRLITDEGNDDKKDSQSHKRELGKLTRAGIEIKNRVHNGLMHNKFVIVDERILIIGSFNWSHGAVTKNDETVIVTQQSVLVEECVENFANWWET